MKSIRLVVGLVLVLFATHFASANNVNSVQISGSVWTNDGCAHSASGSSISVFCSTSNPDPLTYANAIVSGFAGFNAGEVDAHAFAMADPNAPPTLAAAFYNVSLDLTGTYMLTGGHGVGTVLINFDSLVHRLDGALCTLQFDGQNVDCVPTGTLQFQVAYNTPYQLRINFSASGDGIDYPGNDYSATNWSYIIQAAQGTFAPVPEPSSLLLLGTGLLGAAGALRRKLIA